MGYSVEDDDYSAYLLSNFVPRDVLEHHCRDKKARETDSNIKAHIAEVLRSIVNDYKNGQVSWLVYEHYSEMVKTLRGKGVRSLFDNPI